MCYSSIKSIALLTLLFTTGCTSTKIPIQTQNHPASSINETYQIELSSILDIQEISEVEKQEGHVYPHH
ncbi:hypothetical protein COB11_01920 [Candidatus Aerophobetes bacterium]|uniref:Uncharacterized protein n=1 Tax=Aerophobetes bacterium TaxID=2030807 RepID=A0A2A4YL20_UNCAE|nr:MAG: hypothetical protein COB11_01920 [Candidatus Aerophobetes bacterium]